MTLPLFDDRDSRAPRQVTLVRLSGEIARSLGGIGRLAVEGEVYRPTTTRGGWVFFTLRDRAAQIEVKVPGGTARRSRIVAGERVSVVGNLQWANDRGQVHLGAEEVSPVGAGAMAQLIARTRERLSAEGLIGRAGRPLPALPAVIGVLCGSEAAVRRDIESVAAVRCPGYPIHFEETTVSGPGAIGSIVEAMQRLALVPGVEVVVLARGGGDAPSLLPWSSEEVCRAVACHPVPVVSAIGHDGDRPLCDEVADLRCGTPSLAATAVLPDLAGLAGRVDAALGVAAAAFEGRLASAGRRAAAVDVDRALSEGMGRATRRLERSGLVLSTRHPGHRVASARSLLASLDWSRPVWAALGRAEGLLVADGRHLHTLSPQRTLERGYAVVSTASGGVIRRASEVAVGQDIVVQLAQGRILAQVARVQLDGAGDALAAAGNTRAAGRDAGDTEGR